MHHISFLFKKKNQKNWAKWWVGFFQKKLLRTVKFVKLFILGSCTKTLSSHQLWRIFSYSNLKLIQLFLKPAIFLNFMLSSHTPISIYFWFHIPYSISRVIYFFFEETSNNLLADFFSHTILLVTTLWNSCLINQKW